VTVHLRLFAMAREAAGRASDSFSEADTPTVGALVVAAVDRYGPGFEAVLQTSGIWLNGEEPPEGEESHLHPGDEVAILPPVSGG